MHPSLALGAAVAALAFSLPAQAVDTVYTTPLSGPAESPPNASPGTGFATVTLNPDLHTLRVQATFSGLTGTTTASHIHCCTALPGTGAAGVATTTPTFADFPLGVTGGTYDKTLMLDLASSWNPAFVTMVGGIDNAYATLVAGLNNGTSYFNIHTSTFGGGEIRGFLTPVVAIPEPEMYALLLAGLGLLAGLAKRRQASRRPRGD
jgi:hypothetical protein